MTDVHSANLVDERSLRMLGAAQYPDGDGGGRCASAAVIRARTSTRARGSS